MRLLLFPYLVMRKADAKPLNEPAPHEITKLLKDWSGGDLTKLDRLIPLVYEELHRLAHQHMRRERAGHLLQTSALINEASLRSVEQPDLEFENRNHVFGIAARLMRQILVDEARKRKSAKPGGDGIRVSLAEATSAVQEQAANVVALDDALKSFWKALIAPKARLLSCVSLADLASKRRLTC